ncbi:MAG: hypothetical protein J7L77_03265, partial [Clostridiales bacterium]|nr:hypothetical protein [Clostridiales bacterium]
MKKLIIIVLALACFVSLLVACSGNSNAQLDFSFDTNGSYTGFDNLPDTYSEKEAENDGCLIRHGIEIESNQKVWDAFVKTADKGKEASVRMAYFSDDIDYPYIIDIFYTDGYYYHFDHSADSNKKQPYKYLLTLEGKFGSPVRDSGIIILTDDNALTFDTVMKSMYSSD